MMPEMPCTACRDLLPQWATKRLTTADHAIADRHLATCPACQQVARQWEAIAELTHAQSQHLPLDTQSETTWELVRAHLPPRTAPLHNERFIMTTQQVAPPPLQTIPPAPVMHRPRHMVTLFVTASLVLLFALVFSMVLPRLRPAAGNAPALTRATATPITIPDQLNQSLITPGPAQTPIIQIGTYKTIMQNAKTVTPQQETFSFVVNSFVYVVMTTNTHVKEGDTISAKWYFNNVDITSNLTATKADCCVQTVPTTGKALQVVFALRISNTGSGKIEVFYNNTLAYTLDFKVIPATK